MKGHLKSLFFSMQLQHRWKLETLILIYYNLYVKMFKFI